MASMPWRRRGLTVVALGAAIATLVGISGVGDAPSPQESAAALAAHFTSVRTDVLIAAPFGTLGAAAVAALSLGMSRRLANGPTTAGTMMVGLGGLGAATYLLVLQTLYTAIAYEVASFSPDAAKAIFVITLAMVPVFALAVTTLLIGAAISGRGGLMPRWWTIASAVGAALTAPGVFGYARTGVLSPDVQQQIVAGVLRAWLVATAIALGTQRELDRGGPTLQVAGDS
jgi:hypothetical protein